MKQTIKLQIGWYPEEEERVEDLLLAFGGELPRWLLDKIEASENLPHSETDCPMYALTKSKHRTLFQKFSYLREVNEDGKMSYLVGERLFFDFPAIRVAVECDHCRGEGKTVADNLRGLDFSVEELQRNGDWDDYVSHEGIWQWYKCSRCGGHGCHMEEQIDRTKVLADHAVEWELHMKELDDECRHQEEMEATRRGEMGGGYGYYG